MENNNNKIPKITNENEQEYWLEFKRTLSDDIKTAFLAKYSPLVKYVVSKIYVNIESNEDIEFQDLIGFGSFALVDAIDRYNPNSDIKFKKYLIARIKSVIKHELRRLNRNIR